MVILPQRYGPIPEAESFNFGNRKGLDIQPILKIQEKIYS